MDLSRIVITGCCGSGKSHLAREMRDRLSRPVLFLDHIVFERKQNAKLENSGSNVRRRDQAEVRRLLNDFLAGECWIVEGVYGSLIRDALERATFFLWIDRPEAQCLKSLEDRNIEMMSQYGRALNEEQMETVRGRIRDYRTRNDPLGQRFHQELFENCPVEKERLRSFEEVDRFLENLES